MEIWKIALKYSYTHPQILNRTFKKHYNIIPTQYRKDNIRKVIQDRLVVLEKETISLNGKIMIDLSLEYFKKTKVYGITYSIDLTKTPLTEEEIIAFTKIKSQDILLDEFNAEIKIYLAELGREFLDDKDSLRSVCFQTIYIACQLPYSWCLKEKKQTDVDLSYTKK